MIVASLVLVLGQKLNWNGQSTFTMHGHNGPHHFSVTFKQANFKPLGRHVFWQYVPGSYEGSWPHVRCYVPAWRRKGGPSHEFRGHDSNTMKAFGGLSAAVYLAKRDTELTSVLVVVDGQPWTIAKKLYEGCLNPDLGVEYEAAKLSADGKTLKVVMEGSDGAGSYTMIWTLRKNGRTSVQEEGPL